MIDRLLFLMEKYCDADPKCGPSNSEHQITGAIESTGLAKESKHFYFDVLSQRLGQQKMSGLLLEDCALFNPDLIIYTPLGGALGDQLNPLPQAIRQMSNERKVFLYLSDAKPACGLEAKWLPCVDYLGVVDSISAFLYYRHDPRIIMAYRPVSPRDFYRKDLQRDIDVSFVGSVDPTDQRWPMRHEYTSFLRSNGINAFIGGGQRGNRLSVEEYSNTFNRSKMSLNFCRDGNGIPILKQRVFEVTACGALLLEDYMTEAAEFFHAGKEFVIFHSKEELLKLIRYYLEHDGEREAIAKSGHERVTKVYNARNMWGYIFEKMGFNLPMELAGDKDYLVHQEIMRSLEKEG